MHGRQEEFSAFGGWRAVTAEALVGGPQPPGTGQETSFLVILANGTGFSDARCYVGDVDTPNLDRLAPGRRQVYPCPGV